jgi:hypothetical protein
MCVLQGGIWLGTLGGGPLETDPDTTGGFSNCEEHARKEYQNDAVEVRVCMNAYVYGYEYVFVFVFFFHGCALMCGLCAAFIHV